MWFSLIRKEGKKEQRKEGRSERGTEGKTEWKKSEGVWKDEGKNGRKQEIDHINGILWVNLQSHNKC